MDWEVAGENAQNSNGDGSSPMPPKRKGGKIKKWMVAVVVIAVAIAFLNIQSCIKDQPKSLTWPKTGLATMLPDPPTKKGEVSSDSDSRFSADIEECSEDQYKAYVESCKAKGFTEEANNLTTTYGAYNSDGYKLDLTYWSSMNKMSVMLDAPMQMGTLTWPTTGAGANAPVPVSTKGKVSSDSSTGFTAYVADTDTSAFSAYVDACIAAGYTVDYKRGDTSFSGDRADGAHISVSYEGFNKMRVSVDISKMSATTETPAEAVAEPAAPAENTAPAGEATPAEEAAPAATGNNADFRQFVDEYEAFMNSYCDFMEKYNSSSDTASMLLDYAKMTAQYAEWAQKWADYDTSDVSVDDLAYYNAANLRVADRLSKVQ